MGLAAYGPQRSTDFSAALNLTFKAPKKSINFCVPKSPFQMVKFKDAFYGFREKSCKSL